MSNWALLLPVELFFGVYIVYSELTFLCLIPVSYGLLIPKDQKAHQIGLLCFQWFWVGHIATFFCWILFIFCPTCNFFLWFWWYKVWPHLILFYRVWSIGMVVFKPWILGPSGLDWSLVCITYVILVLQLQGLTALHFNLTTGLACAVFRVLGSIFKHLANRRKKESVALEDWILQLRNPDCNSDWGRVRCCRWENCTSNKYCRSGVPSSFWIWSSTLVRFCKRQVPLLVLPMLTCIYHVVLCIFLFMNFGCWCNFLERTMISLLYNIWGGRAAKG